MQKQLVDKNQLSLLQQLIMSQHNQSRKNHEDRKRLREEEPFILGSNGGAVVIVGDSMEPRNGNTTDTTHQEPRSLIPPTGTESDCDGTAVECYHPQKRHRSAKLVHVIPSSSGVLGKSASLVAKGLMNNDHKGRLRGTSFSGDGVEIIKMLMKSGADGIVDALSSACKEGNASIAKYLLEHHAPGLVHTPCRIGFVQALLRDADASGTNRSDVIDVARCVGWTHLHTACYLGHYEIAKILLENKANVKSMTGNRWTPLHCACYRGHRDIVRLLFEYDSHGKTTTTTTTTTTTGSHSKGSTPLHCACHKGHLDIVELLLERDAEEEVAASTSNGWTPLHYACHHGHLEIVKVLLAEGASLSVTNAKGSTPFHCACYRGHLRVAALLLEKNADVDAIDVSGRTALEYAWFNRQHQVVNFLLMNGAQGNYQGGSDCKEIRQGGEMYSNA